MLNRGFMILAVALVFLGCGSSGSSGSIDKIWDVTLKVDKTKVVEGQAITFDANVTGDKESTLTYTWKDGNTTLIGDSAQLVKDDFSLGEHNVTVEVVNGDDTKSATVSVEVVSFLIAITSEKRNFRTDENVTLDTNVTGAVGTLVYTWKEDTTVVGTDSNLTKDDFTVGSHTIVLTVENGGESVSDSIDINVSDFTNFEIPSGDDQVLIQKSEQLMWVSDMDKTKQACLAIHAGNEAEFNTSKTFCQELNFAGKEDWRKPTVMEISFFITQTIAANILPAYYAPCQILIGTDGMDVDQAIITRYGVKNSFGNTGDTYSTANAALADGKNIGLRCVRDN